YTSWAVRFPPASVVLLAPTAGRGSLRAQTPGEHLEPRLRHAADPARPAAGRSHPAKAPSLQITPQALVRLAREVQHGLLKLEIVTHNDVTDTPLGPLGHRLQRLDFGQTFPQPANVRAVIRQGIGRNRLAPFDHAP